MEIADSDEARTPFWEMVIDASGRMADLERAERHAVQAIDYYRQTGDRVSLTRVTGAFALGLVENNQPERALELLSPWSKTISAQSRSSSARQWCMPAV